MKLTRFDLPEYFRQLGFKVGAEIGVAGGHFSEALCKGIPGLKLYCVDPWDTYSGNRRGGGKDKQFANYELTKEKLKDYDAHLMRMYSMDAVKLFEDNSLDFVFIDGNHDFQYVWDDLVEWSKKVRSGGIVSGHDYYHFHNSGVIEAVNKYALQNMISISLTEPVPGSRDDRIPSFYWFKK